VGCAAAMSAVCCSSTPSRSIDGNTNGGKNQNSCVESSNAGVNWYSIDIYTSINITVFRIYGRTDCCWDVTAEYSIYAGNDVSVSGMFTDNDLCVAPVAGRFIGPAGPVDFVCHQLTLARKIIFKVDNKGFRMCEFQISSSDCPYCPSDSISPAGSITNTACQCNTG